jgi:hypothetical protein
MPQQRAHDVHLGVRRAGVAAATVDLFENQRRLGDSQAGSAVLGRDQRRQPARFGQRAHELGRVGAGGQIAPVARVAGTARALPNNGLMLVRDASPSPSSKASATLSA